MQQDTVRQFAGTAARVFARTKDFL